MRERITIDSGPELVSLELSSRRTGMSFQRTRMSADRTLMSVIRTSLSLISFGFTIAQVFQKLKDSGALEGGAQASRHFGMGLIWLGIGMLMLGIVYHLNFMRELRATRRSMKEDGLIHADSGYPPSMTLITAFVLLGLGIAAVVSMMYRIGPFA